MTVPIDHRIEQYEAPIYAMFRILVGLPFVQHGLQKLFGVFGGVDGSGATASLFSMYGLAGIIELIGGLFIALGILTRLVALVTIGQMIAAQLIVHLPQGVIPIQNGGELSLLYLASFLVLVLYGSGRYSFARLVLGRELA